VPKAGSFDISCTFFLRLQETDRELILRFFAMYGHMGEYRMPLSNFLNDEADRGISLSTEQLQQRRVLFERAISNVSSRAPMPRHLLIVWEVKNRAMLLMTELRCGTCLASSSIIASVYNDHATRKSASLLHCFIFSLSYSADDFLSRMGAGGEKY
jgi:hypothetical protein